MILDHHRGEILHLGIAAFLLSHAPHVDFSDAAGCGGLVELGVGTGLGGNGEPGYREQANQVLHERLLVKQAASAVERGPV
jgi:hypothetical protein